MVCKRLCELAAPTKGRRDSRNLSLGNLYFSSEKSEKGGKICTLTGAHETDNIHDVSMQCRALSFPPQVRHESHEKSDTLSFPRSVILSPVHVTMITCFGAKLSSASTVFHRQVKVRPPRVGPPHRSHGHFYFRWQMSRC